MKKSFLIFLIFTSLLLAQTHQGFPPEIGCFTIEIEGKEIGIAKYVLQLTEDGWVNFGWEMRLDNETVNKTYYKTDLTPEMKLINYYSIAGEDSFNIKYADNWAEISLNNEEKVKSMSCSEQPFILGVMNIGHWAIISKMVKINIAHPQYFTVLPNHGNTTIDLMATPTILEKIDGEMRKKIEFEADKILTYIWVDTTNSRAYRIEMPEKKFVATYNPECPDTMEVVIKSFGKKMEESLELRRLSGMKSNKEIKKPLSVRYLKANIEVPFFGKAHTDIAWQKLVSKKEIGAIAGTIAVDISEYKGKGKHSWKISQLPEKPKVLEQFTVATEDIPVKNERVEILTENLRGKNIWEFTQNANRWVADNIKFDPNQNDAKIAVEILSGSPQAKAKLLCAILRKKGIPCRTVGGLYYFNGFFLPHYWIEVWIGPAAGWRPVDPSTGEDRKFSALHITLFEGDGEVGEGNLEIIKYKY